MPWKSDRPDITTSDGDEKLLWHPTGGANTKHQTISCEIDTQGLDVDLEPNLGPIPEPRSDPPEHILDPAATPEPLSRD